MPKPQRTIARPLDLTAPALHIRNMPRRKIAKLADLKAAAAELPDLTENQYNFVRGLLDGLSASDAYRNAYTTENTTPNVTWVNASRLRSDPKVKLWLSAGRQAHLGTAVVTKESHLREMERLREIALDTGNVGAAVLAETSRGKVTGLYVEQYADLTPHNPAHTLDIIRKISPELALKLAEQAGIKLITTVDEHQIVTVGQSVEQVVER